MTEAKAILDTKMDRFMSDYSQVISSLYEPAVNSNCNLPAKGEDELDCFDYLIAKYEELALLYTCHFYWHKSHSSLDAYTQLVCKRTSPN